MIEVKDGLRVLKDADTLSFALTSMQICGLLLFDKNYNIESDIPLPKSIDELRFSDLFAKIILLKKEEEITLYKDETVLFYVAVNLASRCFVSEQEDIVKRIIPYLSEISEVEYERIKQKYITQAQDTINRINEAFRNNSEFLSELETLSDGMINIVGARSSS